jgi:hypothetical protein
MATLTNTAKNTGSLTAISKPLAGGQIFYGWMFWFTITSYYTALTNTAKTTGTLTNVAKS